MIDAIIITILLVIFGTAAILLRKQSKKFRQEEFDRLREEEEMD